MKTKTYYPPVLVALAFGCYMTACASFLHWKDPGVQSVSCVITGAVLGSLEALAASLGIPLEILEQLYGDACGLAAVQGMSQHDAEQFALRQVSERAHAMHAMGLRVIQPSDGGAP